MSYPRYTLSVNGGAEITVESVSARLTTLDLVNQGVDSLSVSFPRGIARPMPFQPLDLVRVFMDGTPIFRGRVSTQVAAVSGQSLDVSLRLLGPWYELDRWPALRNVNGAPALLDTTVAQANYSPRFDLYGGNVGITAQGTTYTGYAALLALLGPEYLLRSDPLWITAKAPAGVIPIRQQEVNQLKVSQLVSRCVNEWTPHTAVWFDYSTLPPTLYMTRMSDLGPEAQVEINRSSSPWTVDYDLTAGSTPEVPVELTVGQSPLVSYSLTRRDDMIPPATHIRYENGGAGTQVFPVGAQTTVPDALWLLVEGATPAGGTAEFLHETYSALRVEGSLVLAGRTIDLRARPGRVWTILGDDEATARGTAVLWTQRVTHDLAKGISTCQVGYPTQLGCSTIVEQLNVIRRMGVLG